MNLQDIVYVTGFGKIGLIAGWVKIEFLPEKASNKFMRKIWALFIHVALF